MALIATTQENLPEDIIRVQILTRLPIKSLIRFKCVSKLWDSIVSDQQFAKSHLKRASDKKTLTQRLLLSEPSKTRSLDMETPSLVDRKVTCPFNHAGGRVLKILGTCNGMVCVALEFHDGFFIWNPSTGKFLKLPNPGFASKGATTHDFSIKDLKLKKFPVPAKTILWLHQFGFGYVSATDDYKIIVAAGFMNGANPVEVFSSRSNSWKKIETPHHISLVHHVNSSKGTLSNETLHWLLDFFGPGEDGEDDRCAIIAFDLAKEKFGEVPLPLFEEGNSTSTGYFFKDVGIVFGECLCVSRMEGQICEHIQLWVMMEYGVRKSWTKLFNFNLGDHVIERPVFYTESAIFLLTSSAKVKERDLMRFSVVDKDIAIDSGRYRLETGECDMIQYEETLVWLNDYHGPTERRLQDAKLDTSSGRSKQK